MPTPRFIKVCLFAAVLALAGMVQAQAPPRTDEPLVIIVHKSNPVENLSLAALRKLCLGERAHWEEGRRATVILREPGQAERAAVLRQVYGMDGREFRRHFLQRTYTGEVPNAPRQMPSGTGVRRLVATVPGAIGFVRAGEVDDSVKVVQLEGKSPAAADYPLKVDPVKTK